MNSTPNSLSNLLQSWNADVDPSADFNRSVWARIEATDSRKVDVAAVLFSWLQDLARPRIAITAASLALFGGVLLGGLQARSTQEEHYLRSLNPYHAADILVQR